MSSSLEIQEIHSSVKRVVCVGDRVLRSTRSPSPQWTLQKQQSSVADWYFPWVCSCSAWLTHKYTNVPYLFPGQYI